MGEIHIRELTEDQQLLLGEKYLKNMVKNKVCGLDDICSRLRDIVSRELELEDLDMEKYFLRQKVNLKQKIKNMKE